MLDLFRFDSLKFRGDDEYRSGSLIEFAWEPRRADRAADAVQASVGAGGELNLFDPFQICEFFTVLFSDCVCLLDLGGDYGGSWIILGLSAGNECLFL